MKARVLIVDDEPVICRGLRLTVPWEEIGVEIIGEAYNGEQALAIVQKTPVDVILTDVRMPSMNGLELVEILHREDYRIKTIILSGYDEFTYAKKAIRFGVRDYLLKPVDVDELMEVIRRLVLEIKKESAGQAGLETADGSDRKEVSPTQEHAERKVGNLYPRELEKRLLEYLFQHRHDDLRQTVDHLFTYFSQHHYSFEDAFQVCLEILMLVHRRFRETACLKDLVPQLSNPSNVLGSKSLTSLMHMFWGTLAKTSELLKRGSVGKNRWIIQRVKNYMLENYHIELKSRELAEMIHVTPNYFSSIFKQETGKSFNEYLNEIRIEKAKELLKTTSEQVGTIALTVGYNDYKYFSNVFRKYCGVVPSDFRELSKV
jgi:two-component system response regulator YesN